MAIVAGSLFIVLIAANRPSLLAPTTHTGFYPHWMAGPRGGLLPGLTRQQDDPAGTSSPALIVAMYLAYVVVP